eukprot:GHVU01032355.1.p1 GENE.GHVU01032355.1~~GHVU01032355.1.p1  ORF type:complete len:102 (+),score=17.45 GHVU01032355.1:593-898(+)
MYLVVNGNIKQELYACLRMYMLTERPVWQTRAMWLCVCVMLRCENKKEWREIMGLVFGSPKHSLERVEWIILPESQRWLEELEGVLEHADNSEDEGYSEAG